MSDWAALFNSFPGAVTALTEVVGETGHSLQAWLHVLTAKGLQHSQLIEEKTEARKKLIRASCELETTEIMEKTKDLSYRAKNNRLSKQEKHQNNIECVTAVAFENLLNDIPQIPQTEEPSSDWFDLFASYAEKANSDTMRQHWARILEGEIRKPGSFSFCTLQLASMLDHSLAAKIQRVAEWVVEGIEIPHIHPLTTTSLYTDIMDLDSVGFLTVSESLHYSYLEPGTSFKLRLNKSVISIKNESLENKTFKLPCYLLTIAGREIFNVVRPNEEPTLTELFKNIVEKQGLVCEKL